MKKTVYPAFGLLLASLALTTQAQTTAPAAKTIPPTPRAKVASGSAAASVKGQQGAQQLGQKFIRYSHEDSRLIITQSSLQKKTNN